MPNSSDVVIIGGGAAGSAVAYFLALEGVKSTIVEADAVASQASGYAAGQLSPLWGPPLLTPLLGVAFQLQLDHMEAMTERSGVDFHPKFIHQLRIAFEEQHISLLRSFYDDRSAALEDLQTTHPYAERMSFSWLSPEETLSMEPRLAKDVLTAVDAYGIMTVDPYQHTLSVFMAAESLGASLRQGRAVGVKHDGARVTAVVLESGEIPCDAVVLAAGPWSGEAGGWLGLKLPVEPLRGELLHVDLPGQPLEHDMGWRGASFFPRSDGLVRIGSTMERRGFDRRPDDAVAQRLLEGAVRMMPCMEEAQLVRQTVCFRPLTPDQMPLIGRAPGWDNAYLATGAGSKGILLGLAMGKATCDLMTAGVTDLPIEASAPDRFEA
jgi:glycine/D-amino acid oxidase-like deaminating enzyme